MPCAVKGCGPGWKRVGNGISKTVAALGLSLSPPRPGGITPGHLPPPAPWRRPPGRGAHPRATPLPRDPAEPPLPPGLAPPPRPPGGEASRPPPGPPPPRVPPNTPASVRLRPQVFPPRVLLSRTLPAPSVAAAGPAGPQVVSRPGALPRPQKPPPHRSQPAPHRPPPAHPPPSPPPPHNPNGRPRGPGTLPGPAPARPVGAPPNRSIVKGCWLARKDSNLRSPDPESVPRNQPCEPPFERGVGRRRPPNRGESGAHSEMNQMPGITPALSRTARAAVDRAVELGHDAGLIISLDLNLRRKLWGETAAMPVLRELARQSDIVLAGVDQPGGRGPRPVRGRGVPVPADRSTLPRRWSVPPRRPPRRAVVGAPPSRTHLSRRAR